MVRSIVNSSKLLFPEVGMKRDKVASLNGPLSNNLFYFRDKLTGVIENLSFVDPAGDDNCGYYTRQLFGTFLLQGEVKEPINEDVSAAIMETQKMRQFVKDYVIEHWDYFVNSEAMLLCQCPDGIEEDVWRDGLTVFKGLHKHNLDLLKQDHDNSLLNGMCSI
jgi:hypothetical protein